MYLFEGLKPNANSELHITSSNFDEPQGLEIVQSATSVVALHGAAGKKRVVYLGGLNMALGQAISGQLQAAGFDVDRHPGLQGASCANICNRGTSGQGVQLELTKGLREQFFRDMTAAGRHVQTEQFRAFVSAVRAALGMD